MGVSDYMNARLKAFTDTINDAATDAQKNGPIHAIVSIVESGFGLIETNDFGQNASKRRADARKQLTQGFRSLR